MGSSASLASLSSSKLGQEGTGESMACYGCPWELREVGYTVGLRKRLKATDSCRLSGVCRGGGRRRRGERGRRAVGGKDTGKAKATEHQMTRVSLLVGDWRTVRATRDGNGPICSHPPLYAGARWIEACRQWEMDKGSSSSV